MPGKYFLLVVCNCTSYYNPRKLSLPNPFTREKAGDVTDTIVSAYSPQNIGMSALRVANP